MDDKYEKVREHAYRLWDQEGRPEGSHEDHWRRAEEAYTEAEQEHSEDIVDTEDAADQAQSDGQRAFRIATTAIPPG